MNWEAIAAIGEILGATGVIATLAYLGIQTRQNTKAVNASTFLENTAIWQDWFLSAAGLDTSDIYAQGMTGSENMDPLAFQKFWMTCRAFFLNFENQYFQYRQGVLDEDSFKGYERGLCDQILVWPGIRAWWSLSRTTYGTEYSEYIDKLILQTGEAARSRAENPGEHFVAWRSLLAQEREDAQATE